MIKINVEISSKPWHKKIKNPKKYFNKKLNKISDMIKFFKKKNITFTILLTNSLKMKKLNRQFRKHNKPTDVLSFPSLSLKNLKSIKKKKNLHRRYSCFLRNYFFKIKKNKFFLRI